VGGDSGQRAGISGAPEERRQLQAIAYSGLVAELKCGGSAANYSEGDGLASLAIKPRENFSLLEKH
jgi:hypothetical protein